MNHVNVQKLDHPCHMKTDSLGQCNGLLREAIQDAIKASMILDEVLAARNAESLHSAESENMSYTRPRSADAGVSQLECTVRELDQKVYRLRLTIEALAVA